MGVPAEPLHHKEWCYWQREAKDAQFVLFDTAGAGVWPRSLFQLERGEQSRACAVTLPASASAQRGASSPARASGRSGSSSRSVSGASGREDVEDLGANCGETSEVEATGRPTGDKSLSLKHECRAVVLTQVIGVANDTILYHSGRGRVFCKSPVVNRISETAFFDPHVPGVLPCQTWTELSRGLFAGILGLLMCRPLT